MDSYRECPKCGNANDISVVSTDGGYPAEVSTCCGKCSYMGYWSYGYYQKDPDQLHDLIEAVRTFKDTKTTGDMYKMFDLVESVTGLDKGGN